MPDSLGRKVVTRIGLTKETMTDTLMEPIVEFTPGADVERTVASTDRYVGSARCRWTFPDRLLKGEEFHQLKNLVKDDASVTVYIDIPTQTIDTSTYRPIVTAYQCVMHWPLEDVRMVSHYRWQFPDEGILFTRLIPVA